MHGTHAESIHHVLQLTHHSIRSSQPRSRVSYHQLSIASDHPSIKVHPVRIHIDDFRVDVKHSKCSFRNFQSAGRVFTGFPEILKEVEKGVQTSLSSVLQHCSSVGVNRANGSWVLHIRRKPTFDNPPRVDALQHAIHFQSISTMSDMIIE